MIRFVFLCRTMYTFEGQIKNVQLDRAKNFRISRPIIFVK